MTSDERGWADARVPYRHQQCDRCERVLPWAYFGKVKKRDLKEGRDRFDHQTGRWLTCIECLAEKRAAQGNETYRASYRPKADP